MTRRPQHHEPKPHAPAGVVLAVSHGVLVLQGLLEVEALVEMADGLHGEVELGVDLGGRGARVAGHGGADVGGVGAQREVQRVQQVLAEAEGFSAAVDDGVLETLDGCVHCGGDCVVVGVQAGEEAKDTRRGNEQMGEN